MAIIETIGCNESTATRASATHGASLHRTTRISVRLGGRRRHATPVRAHRLQDGALSPRLFRATTRPVAARFIPAWARGRQIGAAAKRPCRRDQGSDKPRFSVSRVAVVPKNVPSASVTATANALQDVMRTTFGKSPAPPVFTARSPRIASAIKAATATAGASSGSDLDRSLMRRRVVDHHAALDHRPLQIFPVQQVRRVPAHALQHRLDRGAAAYAPCAARRPFFSGHRSSYQPGRAARLQHNLGLVPMRNFLAFIDCLVPMSRRDVDRRPFEAVPRSPPPLPFIDLGTQP